MIIVVGWLVVGLRLMLPGPTGGLSFVGVFLCNSSPYLLEFQRKPRKTPNNEVDKRDRGLNLAPPVFQFELITAQPLVGHDYCVR